MFIKSMFAAAAVALALTAALPTEKAHAKTDVDISVGIGFGGGYYGSGYGVYEPVYEAEYGSVNCSKARKIVRWNGFHGVKAIDCSAPSYKFSGWRGGQKYKIKVNSWGDITRVSSY
jgi:hypothetical protein